MATTKQIDTIGKTSPMMVQYLTIKDNHLDCLLFYRMGDFYEIFFDDAINAAAALDITLTKRGKYLDKDIPMCGVPVHSHESYLHKLIAKGFKVAVCEQMESPAIAKARGAKSVVKRDVVRIVTPGTITEDKLLDTRSHNYLAALSKIGKDMALAWLDMSTGDFHVQSINQALLSTVLSRIAPGELLCPEKLNPNNLAIEKSGFDGSNQDKNLDGFFDDWRDIINFQENSRFDSNNGEIRLKEFYGLASLDAFGDFNRAELSAAGSLLDYVKLTQVGNMPRLANLSRLSSGAMMEIDQATRRNLELVKTLSGDRKGSLLGVIDKTITGGGARLLASRISAPLTDVKAINLRLDMVQFYHQYDICCDDLRQKLREIPDMERALSRITLGRCGPRDLAAIAAGLSSNDNLRAIHNKAENINIPNDVCVALEDLGLHDILVERLTKALEIELPVQSRDGGYICAGYSAKLDELRLLSSESKRLILALESNYKKQSGVDSLKIKYNNILGYFIEVTARHAGKMEEPFIHRQSMMNATRYSTIELNELSRDITEAKDKSVALECELFDELIQFICQDAGDIAKAAASIGRLDWASAMGFMARENNYIRPDIDNSREFNIEAGRHPVVENALKNNQDGIFIANDCNLGQKQHLWLVTGPNMAGKSTFLRQNALIAIMAQSGCFVPANAVHIGVIDRLFSRVGAADDLARGRSTFMVEMVETAVILNQATDKSLVILDEIGRGTATFDGLSIAWACVEHLHQICKSRALFATHYHELNSLDKKLECLSPHAMKVKEWQGDVIFLHEVVAGCADRSYGIHVARLAGLPQSVVARAEQVLINLQQGQKKGQYSDAIAELANDLPLFKTIDQKYNMANDGGGGGKQEIVEVINSEIDIAIDKINPDDMSPREALEILYKLKQLRD